MVPPSAASSVQAPLASTARTRPRDRGDSSVTDQLDDRRPEGGSGQADRRTARRRLRRRVLAEPASVESYLRGNSPPRYMQRLRQIETEFATQCRRLRVAYEALLEEHGDDAALFARRWRARAQAWRFDQLNDLVREHNAWYPVEASLPMDPRTRNFVPVRGGSYRRLELGARWVLEHFPPDPAQRTDAPELPKHAPREPLPGRPVRTR
jgi:uncharacterized protein YchJ